jgi:predicted regulator of Ras-like GTPase activity (Roadblock/LC7/MglB family)
MFRSVLSGIRDRVEGTIAISLMGLDGIAIESITTEELQLEAIGAELGSFLKSIRSSNSELHTGDVEQFSLATERYVTLLSAVTSEYFILMILSRAGNYGRARYELRKAKFALQDELI